MDDDEMRYPFSRPRIEVCIDENHAPEHLFTALRRKGFLSLRALRNREGVIATIRGVDEQWKHQMHVAPGQEFSSDVLNALLERRFIGIWGQTWGMTPVKQK